MATATETHNKKIVQRWIDEVFNSGSLAAVDHLKVSSYLDWTPLPSPYQDVDRPVSGIKDALPEWLSGLPDFSFTADHLTAEDDFVVCLGHWQAHHEGAYKGIEATGRRVGGTRIDIFRVAGDKMVEHWGCGNELAFMQLVGALESSDGEAGSTDEDVARRFVSQVLGARDVAAVTEVLDPRAVDHSGQALALLALFLAFPDASLTPVEVASSGDTVTVTSRVTGTHEGAYLGIPATGRRVEFTRTDHLRLRDGRIVECRAEFDREALAAQLGGTPAATASGPGDEASAREVVQRFVDDVLNAKDFAAAPAYQAGEVTDHFTGSLTAALTLAGFPDFQLAMEHVVQEGDSVTILATFSGTHGGPVLNLAPTNQGVTGRVALSFRLGPDGRIAETWTELEPWTLLQQLGARFGPAA